MTIINIPKISKYVGDEKGNCLNYMKECWTCVYFQLYGQSVCSRPNQPTKSFSC